MNFRRLQQVIQYGWQDALTISQETEVGKGRLSIFCDILQCFFKYNVWSNQYKKEKLYALPADKKKEVCLKYQQQNTFRDQWVKEFFDNYKFLYKWSNFKYEISARRQQKRRAAYKKQYGLGDNCFIGYDVIFHKHHYVESKIVTGKDCTISEHVNIDYTGGLVLGDRVTVSEGAKILTHNHVTDFTGKDLGKGSFKTPLKINDRVWIGSRAMILPGVTEIGRGAMIGADAYVRSKVPPYAMVMGNPGKIVGFRMSPEEVVALEKEHYEEKDRLPLELLEKNYENFFMKRGKEIRAYTSQKA